MNGIDELKKIRNHLMDSKNDWRWRTAMLFCRIPYGRLITYGELAKSINAKYSLNITARNVAWLRKYLYRLLTHQTTVPLHRIAKKGDIHSRFDSIKTKSYNDKLRQMEGILNNPNWMRASEL